MALLTTGCVKGTTPTYTTEIEGSAFEVRVSYSTSYDNGSSSGHSTLIERVIEVSDDGIVVEFDFAEQTSDSAKAREWRYPARLLVTNDGEVELVNPDELAERNRNWRNQAGFDKSACGQWYFTWNAFKIECDPYSVVSELESYNLHLPNIHEGIEFSEPGTLHPQTLELAEDVPTTLVATFELDPEAIRMDRAEEDVITAQIVGPRDLTLEDALLDRESEEVRGTLKTTLELDGNNRITSRTRVTVISIEFDDGTNERMTSRVTTHRRLLSED